MGDFLNIKKEIIDNIQIGDLDNKEQLLDIANIIGMEATKLLIENYSGVQIYIPDVNSFGPVVKRVICQEKYQNVSKQKIAKELRISVRTLQRKMNGID